MLPAYIHFPSTPTLNFQQNQSKYVFISDCSDLRARFRSLMRMYLGPGSEALRQLCVSILASKLFSTPSLFRPLSLRTLCSEFVRATSWRSWTSPCSRLNLQLDENWADENSADLSALIPVLSASEMLHLVCTCQFISSNNNLAANMLIRCLHGALMVFNATCRYEKDQVAEYLASVQVRLFHTCVTICEMAFDRFCNDCAQNEQFDCLDTRMQQYQFVPPFVSDQLQCLERCNTKPLEAEQLLEVQQTVSLHFNSCLPFGF